MVNLSTSEAACKFFLKKFKIAVDKWLRVL